MKIETIWAVVAQDADGVEYLEGTFYNRQEARSYRNAAAKIESGIEKFSVKKFTLNKETK